ncbi:transposase, partial [Motilimonas pumila]
MAQNSRLSDEAVVSRWQQLFSLPLLVDQWLSGTPQGEAELATVQDIIQVWRQRLCDISWFMRCLNEDIARRANKEDHCKGHFWESRFKSQALLDDNALLACMAYVDLNPIRAGMCDSVDAQDFTSIYERIAQFKAQQTPEGKPSSQGVRPDEHSAPPLNNKCLLLPFARDHNANQRPCLPFYLEEYFDLVDWTGRAIRDDK